MSKTVDTRTVEMRFDNKNFESNAKQTMSTLDKLKKSLRLDGASKGLEEVEKKSKNLKFKDLDRNIDNIGKKFSALEAIATGAFMKIGMSAADAGMKIVKSFTIDQISAGWNKYAQMTSGVQMIMANLADDTGRFIDEADKMDYVNARLKELMTFTDETSYRFTDMMDNAGKWVAAGVDLDKVVTSMEGISTMAAMAGKKPAEASAFFNVFSNAIQRGYVTARDWYTLGKVFTAEAKKETIAIAEEMGLIEEGTVTIENFRSSFIGKGEKTWLKSDVLLKLFQTYGSGAKKMIQYMNEAGVSGSEALRALSEEDEEFAKSIGYRSLRYAQEAKTFGEAMDATADAVSTKWGQIFNNIFGNYEQARELWTNFSEDLWEIFAGPLEPLIEITRLWNRGFEKGAGLGVLDYAFNVGDLDSVQSKFHYITEEAANAAVAMDDSVYSIKEMEDGTRILVKRVEQLGGGYKNVYKEIYKTDEKLVSGRSVFFEGMKNLLNAFALDWEDDKGKKHLSILGSIKQAFLEIFFPDFAAMDEKTRNRSIAEKLTELAEKFRDFTEKIKPIGEKLKKIFQGFFRVFKIIGKIVKSIVKPFKNLFEKIFGNIPDNALKLGDSIADWLEKLDEFLDKSGVYEAISDTITGAINAITEALDWLSKTLTGLSFGELLDKIKKDINEFFTDFDFQGKFDKIKTFFTNISEQIQQLQGDELPDQLTPFQNFCIALQNIFGVIKKILGYLSVPFKKVTDFIAGLFGGTADAVSDPKNKNATEKINPMWEKIKEFYTGVIEFFKKVGDTFKNIGEWIKEKFQDIKDSIKKFFEEHDIMEVIDFLVKSGLIASLTSFILAVSGLIRSFSGIGRSLKRGLDSIRGVVKAYRNEINASAILEIAMSIGIIAGALWILAQIPSDKIGQVIGLIVVISAVIAGFMFLVDKIKKASDAGKNLAEKVKEGPLAQIKDILVSTVGASIFANDATAKFVKICAGILLAAIAIRVVVGAIFKAGDAIVKLAAIPPEQIKQGGKVAAMILLAFGAFAFLAGTANKASSALFAAIGMYVLVLAIQKLIDVLAELGSNQRKLFAVRLVVNMFKDVFEELKKLIATVVAVGVAVALMQTIIVGFASFSKNDSNDTSKVLKQFGKTFTRIAASLLIVAAAFIAMGLAVKGMSPENIEKIGGIFATFIIFITVLLSAILSLDRFGKGEFKKADTLMEQFGKVFTRIAASLLIVSAAFAIMALVTKNMSDTRFNQIRWMFLLFVIFVGVLTDGAMALEEFGHGVSLAKVLEQFGKVFTRVAASLLIVAAAFAVMSLLPFNKTSFGAITAVFGVFIAIVGGIAIAIAAIAAHAPDEKPIKALNALSILVGSMALSLLAVAGAFAIMASIDFKDDASLLAIALVLGGFLVIVGVIGILAGALIKEGTAIIGIAAVAGLFLVAAGSLALVALAIKIMADSATPEEMTTAVGVIVAFGLVIAALSLVGILAGVSELGLAGVPEMALLMVAAAGALMLVGLAIRSMGDLLTKDKIDNFNKIVLAFGLLVGAMAVIGILVGTSMVGLAGVPIVAVLMVAAAGALALIGAAIGSMGDSLTEDKINNFINLITAFGVLIAALAGIGLIAGISVVGMAGIALIAGLILSIGAACLMAGVGISMIVTAFTDFIDAFGKFVDIIATKGPEFVENISDVIEGFLDAITNAGPKLEAAIGTIITALFNAVSNNIDKVVGIAILLISAFASGMEKATPIMARSVVTVLTTLVITIWNTLGDLIDPAVKAFISYINSIADAIRNNAQPMVDAGKSLIEAFIEAFLVGLAGMADVLFGEGNIVSGWIKDAIPDLRIHFGVIPDDAGSGILAGANKIVEGETKAAQKVGEQVGTETASAYQDAYNAAYKETISKDSNAVGEKNTSESTSFLSGLGGDLDLNSVLGGLGLDSSSMSGALSELLPAGEGFSSIESWITPLNGEFDLTSIFGNIPEGMQANVIQPISDSEPEIRTSSESIAKAVEEPITSLDSKTWGEDLMSEFGNGMLSKIGDIRDISEESAQVIKDILGFSEPKTGPLSNFHTYAPDMVKLWCSGIYENLGLIDESSNAMASKVDEGFGTALDYVSGLIDNGMTDELTIRPVMDLSEIQNGMNNIDSMFGKDYSLYGTSNLASSAAYNMRTFGQTPTTDTPQQSAPSNSTFNNTFNITNPDPDAVANRVSKIIQHQVNRKQAVWAK